MHQRKVHLVESFMHLAGEASRLWEARSVVRMLVKRGSRARWKTDSWFRAKIQLGVQVRQMWAFQEFRD